MSLLSLLAPAAEGFDGSTLSTYAWAFGQGVLVDLIQSARSKADALIINPAAYSLPRSRCSMP